VASLASQARSYGATVTALGLGLDYDEILLGRIAQVSGGSFRYIEDAKQVAAVFKDEVTKLNQVVAQNMQLTLTFGPGIAVKAIHGHPSSVGGRRATLSLGQMGMGETRDIFVVVDAPGRSDQATIEVMDAELHYSDVLAGGASIRRHAFVAVQATSDDKLIGKGRRPTIELEAARAAAAAATVQAIALARGNQLAQAKALLTEAERTARRIAAEHDGDPALIELADSMASTLEALPSFVTQVHLTPATSGSGLAGVPQPVEDDMPAAESMARVKRSHHKAERALRRR
jgi:Ca-activated chloride channel family protein